MSSTKEENNKKEDGDRDPTEVDESAVEFTESKQEETETIGKVVSPKEEKKKKDRRRAFTLLAKSKKKEEEEKEKENQKDKEREVRRPFSNFRHFSFKSSRKEEKPKDAMLAMMSSSTSMLEKKKSSSPALKTRAEEPEASPVSCSVDSNRLDCDSPATEGLSSYRVHSSIGLSKVRHSSNAPCITVDEKSDFEELTFIEGADDEFEEKSTTGSPFGSNEHKSVSDSCVTQPTRNSPTLSSKSSIKISTSSPTTPSAANVLSPTMILIPPFPLIQNVPIPPTFSQYVKSTPLADIDSNLIPFVPPADPSSLLSSVCYYFHQVAEDISKVAQSSYSTRMELSCQPVFAVLYSKVILLLRKTVELVKAIKDWAAKGTSSTFSFGGNLTASANGAQSGAVVMSSHEVLDKFLNLTLEFLYKNSTPNVTADPHILAASRLSEGIAKLVPKQIIQKINLDVHSIRLLSIHLIATLTVIKGHFSSKSKKKHAPDISNDIFMELIAVIKAIPTVMVSLFNYVETLEEIRKPPSEEQKVTSSPRQKEHDESENIWLEKREITENKYGNLNMLVKRLTSADTIDNNFLQTFVLTYRSFTTPDLLLEKLIQRFSVPEDEPKRDLIQRRVVVVLNYWVDNQFFDFDDELVSRLKHFIDNVLAKDGMENLSRGLNTTIDKKMAQRNDTKENKFMVSDSLMNTITHSLSDLILSTNEEDIAKQLTLIDWKNFVSIEMSEYLNQAWNRESLQYRSTNLLTMIGRLNKLSYWVCSAVLFQDRLHSRVNIFCKFITIAQYLHKLKNFNSLMGVIAGLNMSSLLRLNYTRAKIPAKVMNTLKSMEKSMSPDNSYRNYRGALEQGGEPKLPYLGVDLRDLTFIEDGNQDYIDGMINFQKRELVYGVIKNIKTMKNNAYSISVQEPLHTLLTELPCFPERDLYELSLLREPRNSIIQQILQ